MPSARGWSALPLFASIFLHGWVTGAWWISALLALLTLSSCVLPRNFGASRSNEFILVAAALGAGVVLGAYLPFRDNLGTERGLLGPIAARLAAAALLAALTRRFVLSATGGQRANLALGLVVVVACGSIRPGPVYPWFVALFALVSVVSLSTARRSPGSLVSLSPVRKLASAFAVGSAITIASVLAWSLPLAHARIIQRIGTWQRAQVSGFSDRIALGGDVDLSESDEVVLRVEGGRVDYLRGATWQRYVRGEWRPWPQRPTEASTPAWANGSSSRIVMRPQTGATRYFLPKDAMQVETDQGRLAADGAGMVTAPWGEAAGTISFASGHRDAFWIHPPSAADEEVPEAIRSELAAIAGRWIAGAESTRDKLLAIESRLRADYVWSLHHRRATRGDPVLDFLVRNRVGHCEYFASAMALLARACGVPARVVGGYRVTEHNALGNYDVVRQYNAHAWVEAWLPDQGWTTFDPTPSAASTQGKPAATPWMGAAIDLLLSGALSRWITTPSGRWIASLMVSVAGLYVFRRRIAGLWTRRSRPMHGGDPQATLASMQELLDGLAARGHLRAGSEPLERYAARLRSVGGLDPGVSEVIEQYARLRYGDLGDEPSMEAALRAAIGRLSGV